MYFLLTEDVDLDTELNALMAYVLGLISLQETIETESISFSITLDALRSGGGLSALTHMQQEKVIELFDSFFDFVGPLEKVMPAMLEKVLDDPELMALFVD